MILWAIRYTTNSGSTWLDYTSTRASRRECWAVFERESASYAESYRRELATKRRKGLIKAVKVTLREVG